MGPAEFRTTYVMQDGTQLNLRPIHPTDEPAMKELFYALSLETIYYRFMSHLKHLPRKEIHNFVFINHRSDVAIVATLPASQGEEMIAIGRYYLDESTNLAEVAFVVRDEWQNRGIGSFLLRHLATIAKRNGISGFTAEVLRENRAMQRVFQKSHYRVQSRPTDEVVSFRIDLSA